MTLVSFLYLVVRLSHQKPSLEGSADNSSEDLVMNDLSDNDVVDDDDNDDNEHGDDV